MLTFAKTGFTKVAIEYWKQEAADQAAIIAKLIARERRIAHLAKRAFDGDLDPDQALLAIEKVIGGEDA